MPAALDIDRGQVQMNVLTYGVREAARMMGLSEDTVATWSARGRWLQDAPKSVPPPPSMVQAVKASVVNPVDAFKNALNERGNKSRLNVAKGLGAAADSIAEMTGHEVLANSQDVKNVVGSLSTVHQWDQQGASVKMQLNLTAAQGQTIEAEVIQDAGAEELP